MAATADIASQTAAATGSDITVASGATIQVWTYPALGSSETVSVWRTSGGSPEDEIRAQDGGRPIELGHGINSIALTGPGTFRLKKSATATETVVYYDA